MVRIDGSRFSGSGTIVRQAVALSALTGRSVHITNIRFRRPNPGLRPQHARAVEAIASVVGAAIHGNTVGSGQLTFEPGAVVPAQTYVWDIGSAGSTVLLAQAVLPVLAFAGTPSVVELRGGLFQDFAPSFYHFRYVLLPLLRLMGIQAEAQMVRPGYVPGGSGILRLAVQHLLEDLRSGATLDRHAADQIIIFGALAAGESRFCIPGATEHVETGAWLAREFLGADVRVDDRRLVISGVGLAPRQRGK